MGGPKAIGFQGMRRAVRKRRKLDYPEVTNGTRWTAEARRLASKLTPEEEAEHFARAMVKIYGGKPKEIAGTGHESAARSR